MFFSQVWSINSIPLEIYMELKNAYFEKDHHLPSTFVTERGSSRSISGVGSWVHCPHPVTMEKQYIVWNEGANADLHFPLLLKHTTPPKSNMTHLKMHVLLKIEIVQCHAIFQGCIYTYIHQKLLHLSSSLAPKVPLMDVQCHLPGHVLAPLASKSRNVFI